MKNSNSLKIAKTRFRQTAEIDANLYQELRALNIVSSKDALSSLCHKNVSYVRSMHSRRCGITIGSLALLREELSRRLQGETDPKQATLIGYGMKAVEGAIRAKYILEKDAVAKGLVRR